MPCYYFNVYNDDTIIDDEGSNLADDAAAMTRGVLEARTLAADDVRHGHLIGHHRIEILDSSRKPIGSVRFDEAVNIQP